MEVPTEFRISEEDAVALRAHFETIQGGMHSVFNAYTFVYMPLAKILEGEVSQENFEELLGGLQEHLDYGNDEHWPAEIQNATTAFFQEVAGIVEQLGFEIELLSDL